MASEITGILTKYGSQISADLKDFIQSKPLTKYGVVNASGDLWKSVRQDQKDFVLRIYALDYIYYIEKGRKPGKRPPKKAIREWLDVKPKFASLEAKEKDSLAYLIAKKIGEEGTTIYQQGGTKLLDDILTDELKGNIQSELILTFRNKTNALMRSAILGK